MIAGLGVNDRWPSKREITPTLNKDNFGLWTWDVGLLFQPRAVWDFFGEGCKHWTIAFANRRSEEHPL